MNRIVLASVRVGVVLGAGIASALAGTTITPIPTIDPQQGQRRFALDGDAFVYWGAVPGAGQFRDLYVQPTDGGPRRLLYDSSDSPTAFTTQSAYRLSIIDNGQTALFTAPVDASGEVAVFRAPIDGSSPPIPLMNPPTDGGTFSYGFTDDEAHLHYTGVFDNTGVRRIFTTPLDGSGSAIALTPANADSVIAGVPPSSDRIVYRQGPDLSVAFFADGSGFSLGNAIDDGLASGYGEASAAALFRGISFRQQQLFLGDLDTPGSLVRIDTGANVQPSFGVFGDTHAVYIESKDVYSYSIADGVSTRLDLGLPDNSVRGLWETPGGRVLFGVARTVGGGSNYYTQSLDGNDLQPLVADAQYDSIVWLTTNLFGDSVALAKVRYDSESRDELVLIDLSGNNSVQPLSDFDSLGVRPSLDTGDVTSASAAPIIAYGPRYDLTFRGDVNDLYVARTDGSGDFRRLTELPENQRISSISLSSDGRWAVIPIVDYDIDNYDSGDTPVDARGLYAVDTLTGHLVTLAALEPDRFIRTHGFAGDTNRLLVTVFDEGESPASFSVNLVPIPEPAGWLLACALVAARASRRGARGAQLGPRSLAG